MGVVRRREKNRSRKNSRHRSKRDRIETATGVKQLHVRFDDAIFDLDAPVEIWYGARRVYSGSVPRHIAIIARTLDESNDPAMLFTGEVTVQLE
jgi:hypothetical protein